MKGTVRPRADGWGWPRVLHRATTVLREEGLKSLWVRILNKTIARWEVLLERPLDEPLAEITSKVPVEVGLLKETEVGEYIAFRPETDPSDLRHRLEAGQLCFAVRHKGRIISASWVATGPVWSGYLKCEVRLAADEGYAYDSFTVPDFRNQSISSVRSAQMMPYLRDAGYRRLVGIVMPANKPSLRQAEKVGYRPFGVMGYVKLGPWRWNFYRVRRGTRPPGAMR